MVSKYSLQGDAEAVLELIYLEFVMLRERGKEPSVEQFQSRFPHFSQEIHSLLEVDSVIGVGLEPVDSRISRKTREPQRDLRVHENSRRQLGQYQIIEVIGRGGMGVVYRAIQERLNRTVALKTLNILASLEHSARDRFQSEARLAAQLQHPNIVQIYEIGADAGVPYFSMELVEGGTLAQVLKEGPLPPATAAALLILLARAVDYAHSHGVIHRDLKPANVLLASSTRGDAPKLRVESGGVPIQGADSFRAVEPKIADFGLAKELECAHELTASGTMLGTPSFMAPEQVSGSSKIGASCDVYALGAILYNMLSGQPPFLSANVMETVRLVREKDPVPLRHVQPNTPRDLETICLKCLRKNSIARYANVSELANDLECFVTGQPIAARPAGVVERLTKWARRHPSLAALFLSVCTALVAITWLWQGAEGSRRAEQIARMSTEQSLYAQRITSLHSQLRLNHISENRVREKLDELPVDQRGWEWHYLRGLCEQSVWESPRNKQAITTAVLSPDGRYAALGFGKWGYDSPQAVEVWDTWENKLKWRLKGHPNCQVCCVQFSPDGQYLASSAIVWRDSKTPGRVLLWKMSDGSLEKSVANINSKVVRFSPDGRNLLVGGMDGIVRQFSREDSRSVREFKGLAGMILDIRLSPDSRKMVVSGRSDNWGVFDIESGKADWILRNEGDIRQLCWSSDGSQLTVGDYGGRVRVFQVEKKGPILLRSQQYSAQRYNVSSPDGMWLATACFGSDIEIREERSWQLIGRYSGHGGDVRALAFDGSCRRMISAGSDGVARVWDLAYRPSAFRSGHLPLGSSASCVDYHPTKPQVALATKKNVSRAGQFRSTIEIHDTGTLRPLQSLLGHTDELTAVAYRDDGQQLVSSSRDKTVRLWDTATGAEQAVLHAHQSAVILANYVVNGAQLISVDEKGNIILWDVALQRQISNWETNQQVDFAAFNSGRSVLATATESGQVMLWDCKTQKPIKRQLATEAISCIVFSNQNNLLAIAGEKQEIDLWDLDQLLTGNSNGQPAKRLVGVAMAASHLCFSPDDSRLCAVGRDEMVRIYDTDLGNELLSLESEPGNEHLVSFSGDGRQLMRTAGLNILTWNILDQKKKRPASDDYTSESLMRWHRSKASAAVSSDHFEAAIYHVQAMTSLEPENRDHHCTLAMLRMKKSDWQGAEADFRNGIELSSSILHRSKFAITLLRLNKLDEYLKHCQLLTVSAHLSNAPGIQMAARTIALAPDAGLNYRLLARLVQKTQTKSPEFNLLNTLALLQYRSGDFDLAIETAKQSMKVDQKASAPMDWMIIALAKAKSAKQMQDVKFELDKTLHPTISRYAGMVSQWCQQQETLIAAGKQPSTNYAMAREELPFLYSELIRIVGKGYLPELKLH